MMDSGEKRMRHRSESPRDDGNSSLQKELNSRKNVDSTPQTSRPRTSRAMNIGALFALLFVLAQLVGESAWFENSGLKLKSKKAKNSTAIDDDDHDVFDYELWPQLQRTLCPAGLPELKVGPTLFDLARDEYGDAVKKYPYIKTIPKFFAGHFGSAVIVDGNDPSSSIMYVRIFKCANNQIRAYLERSFNQRPDGHRLDFHSTRHEDEKENSNANYTMVEYEKFLLDQVNKDAPEDGAFFRYKQVDYAKPCVFTVMRDPVNHFLSGYNEVETRDFLVPGYKPNNRRVAPFVLFPTEPDPSKDEDKESLMELRFERFVLDLVEFDPFIVTQWTMSHVFPLSRYLHPLKKLNLLPTMGENPQNWILPSVKNLTETLPPFIAERCPRFAENYPWPDDASPTPYGLPDMRLASSHKSSSDPYGTYKAAKNVFKRGGRTARALCIIHAFDYGCFYGDAVPSGTTLGPSDIPEICRKVFASDKFIQAVETSASKPYGR